jgi:hypothetical protein
MGGAIARALFAPCPKVPSLSSKATRRTGWLAKRAPIGRKHGLLRSRSAHMIDSYRQGVADVLEEAIMTRSARRSL